MPDWAVVSGRERRQAVMTVLAVMAAVKWWVATHSSTRSWLSSQLVMDCFKNMWSNCKRETLASLVAGLRRDQRREQRRWKNLCYARSIGEYNRFDGQTVKDIDLITMGITFQLIAGVENRLNKEYTEECCLRSEVITRTAILNSIYYYLWIEYTKQSRLSFDCQKFASEPRIFIKCIFQ